MTDVEIISLLCQIDEKIREIKKSMGPAVETIRQFGMTKLPQEVMVYIPEAIDAAKRLLRTKNELRLQLWKEYGIFYWSDV